MRSCTTSAPPSSAAERAAWAGEALATLVELAGDPDPPALVRDAAIKRFEYTFDTMWKAARICLLRIDGRVERSPKSVIRACRELGLLTTADAERALAMSDDRNRTAHTDREELARDVMGRLGDHAALLARWHEALLERMAGIGDHG